jgi:colanic acid/amylovoran biosynthesis glycosyltransferase
MNFSNGKPLARPLKSGQGLRPQPRRSGSGVPPGAHRCAARRMSRGPYRLAYLGRILPTISETFVVREIVALRRLGLSVKVFSLNPPETGVCHPEAPDLAREAEVLIQPQNPLFWLAHPVFALRFPGRYFHCLYAYVLTADEPWPSRRRCLAYFMVAPFAAWRLRRAGILHLHAHFANAPASVALMAAALAGISFSFTAHAYDIFIDKLLLPAKLGAAAFVACISRYNRRHLRGHYPEARLAHLEVVRNGLDTARFCPEPHPQGVPPCIIAVGRLVETKGFHVLVEACARLRDRGLPCQCLIIGDGPEAGRLKDLVNDFGVNDRVVLKGKLPPAAMLSYYRRADVLAMPSCIRNQDADGIPTVLIEAMAMEIPVVATRVSGIPELVVDGETGLLVAPDDAAALAEALARLIRDRDLARRLAQAGHDLVVSQFNGENSALQLSRLFAAAVKARGKQ